MTDGKLTANTDISFFKNYFISVTDAGIINRNYYNCTQTSKIIFICTKYQLGSHILFKKHCKYLKSVTVNHYLQKSKNKVTNMKTMCKFFKKFTAAYVLQFK